MEQKNTFEDYSRTVPDKIMRIAEVGITKNTSRKQWVE